MRPQRLLIGLAVLVLVGLAALALLGSPPEPPPAGPGPAAPSTPRPQAARPSASPRNVEPAPEPAAAPIPAAPAAPPSPAPAAADPARISLRGVSGVVVDAVTGAPIEGALVTWRPLNQELLARGLGPDSRPGNGTFSGKDGRFALARMTDRELSDRQPPPALLRAVVAGYSPAALAPGLLDEVRFELQVAGSLAVTVVAEDGDVVGPRLRAVACDPDVDRAFAEEDRPDGKGTPPVFRFLRLAPGTWAVELDGLERARAVVEGGRETALQLSAPGRWSLIVKLVGRPPASAGPVREVQLLERRGPSEDRCSLPARSEGVFAGSPRPGARTLLAILGDPAHGRADRAIIDLGRIEGPGEHRVPFPALLPVRIELPEPSGTLILLALEREHLFLAEPGAEAAVAPARYALFREPLFLTATTHVPPQFLGELDLTAAPPVVRVAPALRPASLAFALPEGLREGEALRARIALVPACLSGAADRVRAHLEAPALIRASEPRIDLGPILPGTYLVRGTTDLGPFEATVELPGEAMINLR